MSPHDIIGLPEAAGQSKADACVLAPLKRLGTLFELVCALGVNFWPGLGYVQRFRVQTHVRESQHCE